MCEFFFVTINGMPNCLGISKDDMRSGFFDIVSILGAHFHFSFEDYRKMKTSEILELVDRYKKHCKQQERNAKRKRR